MMELLPFELTVFVISLSAFIVGVITLLKPHVPLYFKLQMGAVGCYTLAIGDVMSEVIEKRVLFFPGTLAALSASVIYHSIYNIVVQSEYIILGFLLPIFTYMPFLIVSGIKAKKDFDTERKTAND